ncbi:MAG: hypothetical protein J6P46_00290 [Bacteroidales bacterium]|nr:hypothetical protein [Bacteroidales bacterium]
MKKYTHAWLAFMAMKRLEFVDFSTQSDPKLAEHAKSLVRWFKNYRDYVIEGAWYPDQVFKDMGTSHIIKYVPDPNSKDDVFKKLPSSLVCYAQGKKSPLYGKPFTIKDGNLADRCEAIAHDIVDNLKMLKTEEKGCPISPTNNHIAMRFFILSHYVSDCHMPLHCDARSFSSGKNVHAFIEKQWEDAIKKSYKIDKDNERFFYDPDGYPLQVKPTQLILDVEDETVNRPYQHSWGTKNKNTWDYMSSVSQYSYLKSYKMIPEEWNDSNLTTEIFQTLDGGVNFDQHSKDIFGDAIDSIARIWLHVWARYRTWAYPNK